MKIIICAENYDLINTFVREGKTMNIEVTLVKFEQMLIEAIQDSTVDAYILAESSFSQKATDLIKKLNSYIPVLVVKNGIHYKNDSSDIKMIFYNEMSQSLFVKTCFDNINSYIKTFEKLKKITSTTNEPISFGDCMYDPSKRMLYNNGEKVKKLSAKEGGILEILATNFEQTVMKEIILEKVWHKTGYFEGRSADVYITHLRNAFKKANMNISIKNVSGIGLMLEKNE